MILRTSAAPRGAQPRPSFDSRREDRQPMVVSTSRTLASKPTIPLLRALPSPAAPWKRDQTRQRRNFAAPVRDFPAAIASFRSVAPSEDLALLPVEDARTPSLKRLAHRVRRSGGRSQRALRRQPAGGPRADRSTGRSRCAVATAEGLQLKRSSRQRSAVLERNSIR